MKLNIYIYIETTQINLAKTGRNLVKSKIFLPQNPSFLLSFFLDYFREVFKRTTVDHGTELSRLSFQFICRSVQGKQFFNPCLQLQ
jgi:hypothetical protein